MTIRGDGSSLIAYEVSPYNQSIEGLGEVVDKLFTRLDSDEVYFDTATGNIEFPFSNGASDLTGKTTWKRIFQDWVFIRLREMNTSDEIRHAQAIVINGLYEKARAARFIQNFLIEEADKLGIRILENNNIDVAMLQSNNL